MIQQKEFPEEKPITRNVYDIDAFEIFDALKEKFPNTGIQIANGIDNTAFFELQEDNFVRSLKNTGINLEETQKLRHYILPSDSDMYIFLLGWKLLVIAPFRIEALLSYQASKFSGNRYASKDNFFGLIEYQVCDFVNSINFIDVKVRIGTIIKWVNKNRKFGNKYKITGFKCTLTDEKRKIVYEHFIGTFIDKNTSMDNFIATLKNELLPDNFVQVKWLPGKNALREFLTLISEYKNKDSKPYLPDMVTKSLIPELFIDKRGKKIFLNKKSKDGEHSQFITQIEGILKNL